MVIRRTEPDPAGPTDGPERGSGDLQSARTEVRGSATRRLFDHDPKSLAAELALIGQPPFRAEQILRWVYRHLVAGVDQMTNLPREVRQWLEHVGLYESTVVRHLRAGDGTEKLLLQWADGATTESVCIPQRDHATACISTQVGCPVGCTFCASGLGGLQRQLTAGQIVEQVMRVRQLCQSRPLRNVVFMGLGEPLHNYAATVSALRTINAEWGLNIGARRITVSTVGLPKQMKRLAREGLQITLALSLHAPNDALRWEIIPWARSVSIASLIDAANFYFDHTGREVTIEYVLLGGVNDQPQQAKELSAIARAMRCHVNLIRYNPVAGLPYERPAAEAAHAFQLVLRRHGVNSHLRKSRGLDIEAACGQLRRRQASQDTHEPEAPDGAIGSSQSPNA